MSTEKEMIMEKIEEFARLQDYMEVIDKDSEGYRRMKKRYIQLKAMLAELGVNITELDIIKE